MTSFLVIEIIMIGAFSSQHTKILLNCVSWMPNDENACIYLYLSCGLLLIVSVVFVLLACSLACLPAVEFAIANWMQSIKHGADKNYSDKHQSVKIKMGYAMENWRNLWLTIKLSPNQFWLGFLLSHGIFWMLSIVSTFNIHWDRNNFAILSVRKQGNLL